MFLAALAQCAPLPLLWLEVDTMPPGTMQRRCWERRALTSFRCGELVLVVRGPIYGEALPSKPLSLLAIKSDRLSCSLITWVAAQRPELPWQPVLASLCCLTGTSPSPAVLAGYQSTQQRGRLC